MSAKNTMKKPRGFASLSPERMREIASMGGKSVAPENRSFSQNKELASRAGRKGGQSVDAKNRTFSRDPLLASEAGRKGGENSRTAKKGGAK